jgi:hypothetical protein
MKPELYRSGLNNVVFKPGHTFKLKILELRGDRALIDFGQFRTTADIKIPVTLGEELNVRVLEAGKKLKLGVIDTDHTNPQAPELRSNRPEIVSDENLKRNYIDLKQILNQIVASPNANKLNQVIINIFSLLNSYFEFIDLRKLNTESASRIESYLENSGIFFEKRLEKIVAQTLADNTVGFEKKIAALPEVRRLFKRDLKPNLLMLQHLLEERADLQRILGPNTWATLKEIIDALLADIQRQQGRAIKHLNVSDSFQVFTFNFPLKDEKQSARLKVVYAKKQKSGRQKGFQISLLLSMDRLGHIRTDFFLLENNLNITFFVDALATKSTLQDNCAALRDLLHSSFNQVNLNILVSEKKVKDFGHENMPMVGDKQVDLRV